MAQTTELLSGNNSVILDGDGSVHNFGSGADQVVSGALGGGTLALDDGANRLTIGSDAAQILDAAVTAGRGADSLTIRGGGGGDAISAAVDLGAGNNTVSISRVADAVGSGGSLTTGDGTDNFVLAGDVNGALDMGGGKNTLLLRGAAGAAITGGAGADSVTVRNGLGAAVNLGEGANLLLASGGADGASYGGDAGVDNVTVKGDVDGLAVGLGAGRNVLKISEGRYDGTAAADFDLDNLDVTAGAGDDSITMDGHNKADGSAAELVLGAGDGISLGAGRDTLNLLNLDLSGTDTTNGNTVDLGEGDDVLLVGRNAAGNGSKDLRILAGAGKDALTVGELAGNVSIDMGDGDDRLTLGGASGSGNTVDGGAGLDSLALSAGAVRLADLALSGERVEAIDLTSRSITTLELSAADLAKFTDMGLDGLKVTNRGPAGATEAISSRQTTAADKKINLAALNEALQRRIDTDAGTTKLLRINGEKGDVLRLANSFDENGAVADAWTKVGAWSGYDVWASSTDFTKPASAPAQNDAISFVLVKSGVTVETVGASFANLLDGASALGDGDTLILGGLTESGATSEAGFGFKEGSWPAGASGEEIKFKIAEDSAAAAGAWNITGADDASIATLELESGGSDILKLTVDDAAKFNALGDIRLPYVISADPEAPVSYLDIKSLAAGAGGLIDLAAGNDAGETFYSQAGGLAAETARAATLLKGGAGADIVAAGAIGDTAKGLTTVDLGAGDNVLTVRGDVANAAVKAGSGNDAVNAENITGLAGANGAYSRGASFELGAGDNAINAWSANAAKVTGGAGADVVDLTVPERTVANPLYNDVEITNGNTYLSEAARVAAIEEALPDMPGRGVFVVVRENTDNTAAESQWVVDDVANPQLSDNVYTGDSAQTIGAGDFEGDAFVGYLLQDSFRAAVESVTGATGDWFVSYSDATFLGGGLAVEPNIVTVGAEAGDWYLGDDDKVYTVVDNGQDGLGYNAGELLADTDKTVPGLAEWYWNPDAGTNGEWAVRAEGERTALEVPGWVKVTAGQEFDLETTIPGYRGDAGTAVTKLEGETGVITGAVAGSGVTFALGEGDNAVHAGAITGGAITGGAGNDVIDAKALQFVNSVNLGNGHNRIELTLESGEAFVNGDAVLKSGVTLGTGNDVFLAEGRLNTLNLKMGEGDNRLEVDESAASSALLSTMTAGAGDDYASLSVGAADPGDPQTAIALEGSSLNMGAGDNVVKLTGDLYGISRETGKANGKAASLTSGAGDDDIAVNAGGRMDNVAIHDAALTDAGGSNKITIKAANGLRNATVKLGNGADDIGITAELTVGVAAVQTADDAAALNPGGQLFAGWKSTDNGVSAYDGLEGVGVYGGGFTDTGGDNDLLIRADNIGIMGAVSVARNRTEATVKNTVVSLNGSGLNNVDIEAGYYGMYGGTLNLGSGADSVNIGAGAANSDQVERAALSFNSVLNLGAGDDVATIAAEGNMAYGLRNSSLLAGAGDDAITVTADSDGVGDGVAYAMYADKSANTAASARTVPSKIDAGAGNDVISVTGGMKDAQILAGAGDDRLNLNVNASTAANAVGVVGAVNAAIDGGAGLDVLAFDASANLSLRAANDDGDVTNSIKGFEVIELAGTGATFSIDDLASLKTLTASLTALPAGELKGKILRVNGADAANNSSAATLKFDTDGQDWTRAEGTYRIDGRDYNLFQTTETAGTRKTVTQLLVENTVTVSGVVNADGNSVGDINAVDPLFTVSLTGATASASFTTLANAGFSNAGGAQAMDDAQRIFGAGADKISFNLELDQDGASDSYLDLGAGNNSLTVNGGGGDGIAFKGDAGKTVVVAGAGNDAVSISGVEIALQSANMQLGEGANRVVISASGAALDGSVLYSGAGADNFSLSGGIENESVIDSGAGNDTLVVDSLGDTSRIIAGAGNDTVTLESVAGTDDIDRAVVDLGAGNDSLFISTSAANAALEGGAGLDTLNIAGGASVIDLAGLTDVSEGNLISGLEILDTTNRAANVLDVAAADLSAFEAMNLDGLTFKAGAPNAAAAIAGLTGAENTAATAELNAFLADTTNGFFTKTGDLITGTNLLRINGEKGDAIRLLNRDVSLATADQADAASWSQVGSWSGYQLWASKAYDKADGFADGTKFALVRGATLVAAAEDVNWHMAVNNELFAVSNVATFDLDGNAASTELGEEIAFNTAEVKEGYTLTYNAADGGSWTLVRTEGALTLGKIFFDAGNDNALSFEANTDLTDATALAGIGELTLQYASGVNDPTDLEGVDFSGALTLDFGRAGEKAIDFSKDHVAGEIRYNHTNNFGNRLAADAKLTGSWGDDQITVGWTADKSVTGIDGDVSIGSAAAGYATTTVDLGEGNNLLEAGGAVVNANIRAGAGADEVGVDGAVTGLTAANGKSMSKAATVNLGAGDNSLTAASMAGGSYTGLGGDDDVTLRYAPDSTAPNPNWFDNSVDTENGLWADADALNTGSTGESLTVGMFAHVGADMEHAVRYDYVMIDNPAAVGYLSKYDNLSEALAANPGAAENSWFIAPDEAFIGEFDDLEQAEAWFLANPAATLTEGKSWFGITGDNIYKYTDEDGVNFATKWIKQPGTTTVDAIDGMDWYEYTANENGEFTPGAGNLTGPEMIPPPAQILDWIAGADPVDAADRVIVTPGTSGAAGLLTADGKALVSGSGVAFNMGDGDNSLTAQNVYGGSYTGLGGDDDLDIAENIGAAIIPAGGHEADGQQLVAGAAVKINLGAGDNSVDAASMYGGSITGLAGDDTLAFTGNLGLLSSTAASSEADATNGFTTGVSLVRSSNVTVNLGDGDNSLDADSVYGLTYTGTNGVDDISLTGDFGAVTMTGGRNQATMNLVKLAAGTAATLNLGAGDNSVSAVNMYGGKITGLAGDDTLAFTGDLGALDNSDSNADDVSDSKDALKLATGTAVTVNLGDGDNSLTAANIYGGAYTGTNGKDVIVAGTDRGSDATGDIGALGATGGTSAAKDLLKLAAGTGVTVKLGAGNNSVDAANMYGGSITGLAGNDSLLFNGDLGALDGAETDGAAGASTKADARKLATGTAVTVNLGDGTNSLTAANIYGGAYTGTNGNDSLTFTGMTGGVNDGAIGALGATGGTSAAKDLLKLATGTGVAIKLGAGENSVKAGHMYGGSITGGAGQDSLTFLGDIGALDGNDNAAPDGSLTAADEQKLAVGTNVAINLGDGTNSLKAANMYGGSYAGTNGNDRIDILGATNYDADGNYTGDTLGDLGALATGTSGANDGKIMLAANTGVAIGLGAGDNALYAGNMYGGRITAGAGNDSLNFNGDIGALNGTNVALAETVPAASAKTAITLGDGINMFTAENVYGAAITAGRGNDVLTIGTDDGAGVLRQTSVGMGEGANTLTIGDVASDDGLVYNSTITGGNGGNTITITGGGNAQGAYAMMEKSVITTGSGIDAVSITGDVMSSTIKLGAGNDSLTLNNAEISGMTSRGYNTLIDLGAGDDRLTLTGSTGFAADDGIFSSITGGAGIDTLDLSGLDANGEGTSSANIVFSALNQENNAAGTTYSLKGFDRIDLTGDGNDTLELTAADVKNLGADALLNFTYTVTAGADAGREITLSNTKTLIVNGNAGDIVALDGDAAGGLLGTARHNGVDYNVYQHADMGGAGNYLMVQANLIDN